MVFLISNEQVFEAHFVLATLSTDSNSEASVSQSSPHSLNKNSNEDQRKTDNKQSCSKNSVSLAKPEQSNGVKNASAAIEQLKVTGNKFYFIFSVLIIKV